MAKATAHPDRLLISSEDVEGTEVYGMGDKVIGEIDHLLIEKVSGRVAYAVMSFGGFLGLAHSHYPIPWSALTYDTSLGGFRTNITEEQLRDAPEFSDDSWTDRDWEKRTPALWCFSVLGSVGALPLGSYWSVLVACGDSSHVSPNFPLPRAFRPNASARNWKAALGLLGSELRCQKRMG
jgi:hypothetical protein